MNTGQELIVVGRLARPHGVRGEIAVEPLGDNPERFRAGSELWAIAGDPDALTPAAGRRVVIRASRPHRGRWLVQLAGVDGRDAVEALRGHYLAVDPSEVPAPPPDTYYHFQLVGCRCRDVVAGPLGPVVAVIEDGGGDLLEIERDGSRLLVPFVRRYLRSVDVEAGEIELDLPPGLIEACTV